MERPAPLPTGVVWLNTKFTNVIEEIELKARNFDQDALIEQQAKLRRLLAKSHTILDDKLAERAGVD